MSGHSKWSSIKHKKAIVDAKRGKAFTKVIREITVAARTGGGDPLMNPALRLAISHGKDINMPNDNIDRAIKKGTGEAQGVHYEEQQFEGYGPGGVAFLVRVLTDNKNRSSAEIKGIFGKRGGNLAQPGAVSFQFHRKGYFAIPKGQIPEDDLLLLVTEAGAEDLVMQGDLFEVLTEPHVFETVRGGLEKTGIRFENAEITMVPGTQIPVPDAGLARRILDLVEALEDNDDVQAVYENADIPEVILSQL